MDEVFLCLILTMAVELAFLACTPYRREPFFVPLCLLANFATNVSVNMIVLFWGRSWGVVLVLEALAVLAEYSVYKAAWGGSRRLFLLTLLANALSFGLGLLLFPGAVG